MSTRRRFPRLAADHICGLLTLAWLGEPGLAAAADSEAPATSLNAATPAAANAPVAGPLPYWQAPALPTAVIQGGAIPPGWQPQAVPYQATGPDGRPLTLYFAPTYVFTYQAGPPVPAVAAPAGRRQGSWIRRPGVNSDPPAAGWNYATQSAPPVAPSLPPATEARYSPTPYRFPADSRALAGTPVIPPATPAPAQPSAAAPPAWIGAPSVPALAGPDLAGPAVAGPAVAGPAVAGPAVAGPAAAAPTASMASGALGPAPIGAGEVAAAPWAGGNPPPLPGPPPAGWTGAGMAAGQPPAAAAPPASLPPPVTPIPLQ